MLGGSLVLGVAETIAAIRVVRHLVSFGYQCSPWSKGYIKCIKCSLNTMALNLPKALHAVSSGQRDIEWDG